MRSFSLEIPKAKGTVAPVIWLDIGSQITVIKIL